MYTSIDKRRDSYLELALALASSSNLESVVSLSKSPLFRRGFPSVYDSLRNVEFDKSALHKAKLELVSANCAELDGVAVFSGDSTFIKRPEAKTLKERVMKRLSNGELAYGYESYWSMRLADETNSWAGVVMVERMKGKETVTDKAKKHLALLDEAATDPQLYVLDAGHGRDILSVYPDCKHTDIVMRVKSNQSFYFEPESYQGRGRPKKHGKRFNLGDETTQPKCNSILTTHKEKALRITSWSNLHYESYTEIKGRILKLEFLDDKGKPMFEKPIWLFTTDIDLEPEILARAYLWRSSHELSFRFCKQHLGLSQAQSPELAHCDAWLELVALAMNLLLASRDQLQAKPDPWYPQQAKQAISQRQAQKHALGFFLNLTTPIKAPRPAGKGRGRPTGFKPNPRLKHPILRKTPKRPKPCPNCPFKLAA